MAASLSGLKPVYLIYGTEDLRLSAAVARLTSRVGEGADLDFNSDTFDGDNANVDDVIAASNTLPFASERRLVVVKNADKLAKAGQDALALYAADPSPTTVLVLVGVKFAKNTKLYKAVDKLGGAAEYAAPKKSEYPREVSQMFAERGKSIDADGAELLVAAVGFDLRRLSVEVDKLVAFLGGRDRATRDDVDKVVSATARVSIFEITDAVANRDAASALRLLSDLLGAGESIFGVHALCVRTLRDLIVARSLIDRGQDSLPEIARAVGRPDWQLKNLPRQARGFTSQELVDALRGAAQTEGEMKTSRDSRLAFERWIVKVCA